MTFDTLFYFNNILYKTYVRDPFRNKQFTLTTFAELNCSLVWGIQSCIQWFDQWLCWLQNMFSHFFWSCDLCLGDFVHEGRHFILMFCFNIWSLFWNVIHFYWSQGLLMKMIMVGIVSVVLCCFAIVWEFLELSVVLNFARIAWFSWLSNNHL